MSLPSFTHLLGFHRALLDKTSFQIFPGWVLFSIIFYEFPPNTRYCFPQTTTDDNLLNIDLKHDFRGFSKHAAIMALLPFLWSLFVYQDEWTLQCLFLIAPGLNIGNKNLPFTIFVGSLPWSAPWTRLPEEPRQIPTATAGKAEWNTFRPPWQYQWQYQPLSSIEIFFKNIKLWHVDLLPVPLSLPQPQPWSPGETILWHYFDGCTLSNSIGDWHSSGLAWLEWHHLRCSRCPNMIRSRARRRMEASHQYHRLGLNHQHHPGH